jgi:hypothetical protein
MSQHIVENVVEIMAVSVRWCVLQIGDLEHSSKLSTSSMQIDGVWHTGVVVGGKEYFFGQGIQTCQEHASPFGTPARVIDMGYGACANRYRAVIISLTLLVVDNVPHVFVLGENRLGLQPSFSLPPRFKTGEGYHINVRAIAQID